MEADITPEISSLVKKNCAAISARHAPRSGRRWQLSRTQQDELLEEAIRTAARANVIQEGDIIVGVTSNSEAPRMLRIYYWKTSR